MHVVKYISHGRSSPEYRLYRSLAQARAAIKLRNWRQKYVIYEADLTPVEGDGIVDVMQGQDPLF